MSVLVTKANGTQELFKISKLRSSLKRSGASTKETADVIENIEPLLFDGITTEAIYRKAFEYLRSLPKSTAAKYSLRRAMFGLGPTGFPFEDFLSKLFEIEGYKVKTRLTVKGKCATHEIDVAGFKNDESFVAEAKFHMRPGIKSDLQVAMYSYARYLDLQMHPSCSADKCGITDLYIITNTKFTSSARKYAECVGLKLLSWDYPRNNSLQKRIEKAGVYPVTALTQLSNKNKQDLLGNNIILCRDVLKTPTALRTIGLSEKKIQTVLIEARQLCTTD